jgi:hypothetical protein
MQIDLYKSSARSMADALYIGSIVVDNIKPKPKGDPSVELIISSTPEGEITADAIDLDSSSHAEHLHLSVSLKSLDADSREIDLPDFELEPHEPPPQGLYEDASTLNRMAIGRGFPWIVVSIAAGLIVICLALWFFRFREKTPSENPPQETITQVEQPAVVPPAPPEPPVAQAAPPPEPSPEPAPAPVEPVPVIQAPAAPVQPAAPASRVRTPAPVSSYRVPATIPREGVRYTIRWGDTLWDIADAFYRNPWLYPRIARFNNIRNPNRIISGTTIRIPPKN